MKKLFMLFVIFNFMFFPVYAGADRYSKEYLQSKKHFAIINPIVEHCVESAIKKTLKKQTGANFKVHFVGYTTSSMKQGIFKHLELSGENLIVEEIPVPYVHLKSLTDYNYIDYTKNPIVYKADMIFQYDMLLTQDSLNSALKDRNYQKTMNRVNKLAYPMFHLSTISTKIIKNRLYIVMNYNLPLAKSQKNKTFVASTDLKIENGKIKAKNVHIDSIYGNLGLDRVANLINLLNPLEFTLAQMDTKNFRGKIENVNIIDNNIKVDGKIFIKEDK